MKNLAFLLTLFSLLVLPMSLAASTEDTSVIPESDPKTKSDILSGTIPDSIGEVEFSILSDTGTVVTHDFTIPSASVTPTTIEAGQQVTVNYTHQYSGGWTALENGNTLVYIYLSTNPTLGAGDQHLRTDQSYIGKDIPQQSHSSPVTIPGSTTAGTYYILVVADPTNEYNELVETNNLKFVQISVVAPSNYLNASTTDVYMGPTAGSSATFTISSNISWSIDVTYNASIVNVSPMSGSGNATITVTTTSDNPVNNTRTAWVVISGSGVPDVLVYATQNKFNHYLNASTTDVYMGATAGSSATFSISSNTSWNIHVTYNASIVNVSPTSGSGNATITVTTTSDNTLDNTRTAILEIVGTDAPSATVYATQHKAMLLNVNKTSIDLGKESGASATFNISSNTSWNITDNASWLNVSPTSGSNDATITVTANSANSATTERTATVTITGTDVPDKHITVTQAPQSQLSVSPATIELASSAGASNSITVTSNVSWNVADNAAWLSATPTSGSGSGTVTVTAESANSGTDPRTATVTISASGVSDQTVTVNQSPSPYLTLSAAEIHLAYNSGANATVTIQSNVNWSINETADWLTVSPSSGTGTETVTLSAVTENPASSERSVIVSVEGEGVTPRNLTVTQEGEGAFMDISTDKLELGKTEGSTAVLQIFSNTSWTVNETADWVEVSPAAGSNNGSVTVTAVTANSGLGNRTTTLTVEGVNVDPRIVTVSQIGASPQLSVSVTTLTLGQAAGSNASFDVTSNVEWAVNYSADWITVSPASGSNVGTVTVTAASANTASSPRNVTLEISGSDVPTKMVTVQQIGMGEAPVLQYNSFLIDDGIDGFTGDGDGVIERNEFVDLMITLNNAGNASATGVSATLSSDETGIEVITSTATYGDIPQGTEKTCTNPFRIYITENATYKDYSMSLDISCNEGSYSITFILSVVAATFEKEPQSEWISIYPNPTDGRLTLRFSKPIKQGKLTITDMNGRIISVRDLDIQSLEYSIDIGQLVSGPCILQLVSGQFNIVRKIIVK